MGRLLQDVRYAIRSLARSPGFTSVALLTIALGIGANAAMFSVVDGILLRPLPYPEPDRLVRLRDGPAFAGEFEAYRDQSRAFAGVGGYGEPAGLPLRGAFGSDRVDAVAVTAELFGVLGVEPALGRAFRAGEDRAGAEPVAILGHGLWARQYGADPGIVGRQIELDGVSRRVVGVMPDDFGFPSAAAQLWVPVSIDPAVVGDYWGQAGLYVVGRLAPAATLAQAMDDVRRIAATIPDRQPLWRMDATFGQDFEPIPLREAMVGDVRPRLLLLLGAVGFVLLIACANVANLLLARGAPRRREMAVRAAIGAERGHLVRQLLTESVVLAALGGAVGVVLAFGLVAGLVAGSPAELPRLHEVTVDLRALAFAAGASLLTGLAFGALPARRTSRMDLQDAVRSATGTADRSVNRVTGGLVVAEVALVIVLVVAAGLVGRSLQALQQVDPGIHSEGVLTARLTLPAETYGELHRKDAFHGELVARVRALPAVRDVGLAARLPFRDDIYGSAWVAEDFPLERDTDAWFPATHSIGPGYLEAMGIPLLAGRGFTVADGAEAPRVLLINRTLAARFWPDQDPVGKRLRLFWEREWRTVVGVVGDVRHQGLAGSTDWEVYQPLAQAPAPPEVVTLVVRIAGAAGGWGAAVREISAGIDPSVAVSDVGSMAGVVTASLATSRFTALLLSSFAALALLLGAIGIYGVVAYLVSQRTREIGMRLALGARTGAVLRFVAGRTMGLTGLGMLLGLIAAGGLTRFMEGMLFGVSTTDPVTFAAAPLVLLVVAMIAALLPAHRATRVDPMVALRSE